MARDESVIYGSYTIGGATGPHPFARFQWVTTYEKAFLICDFIIAAPAGTSPTSPGTLQTLCDTAEAALRLPRQRLQVKFGSTTLRDFNPDVAVNSGFNARPKLSKLGLPCDSATARGYRFEVELDLPANLTGQLGRQSEARGLGANLRDRRVVVFEGVWTAFPGATARAQFDAQIGTHCDAFLDTIDPDADWVLDDRDERENDANTEVLYRRVYLETVDGRRSSTTRERFDPAGKRTVVIEGVYLRTSGGGGQSASENYLDHEDTHSSAALAALDDPLTPGTDCELLDEELDPNEQDDLATFRRTYVELIHEQAPGVTDDPDIRADVIELEIVRFPLRDSPVPVVANSTNGATPGVPSGGDTVERPGTGTRAATVAPSSAQVAKLVEINVRYECFLRKAVTDLRGKWEGTLRDHMLALVSAKLGRTPEAAGPTSLTVDPPRNRIVAKLTLQVTESAILDFRLRTSVQEDFGRKFTKILSGEPYEYLFQQGFPEKRRVRAITATFVAGQFDPTTLLSSSGVSAPGWILTSRSEPDVEDLEIGVAGEGVPQLTLRFWQVFETFLYVRKIRRGGGLAAAPGAPGNGGQGAPNGGQAGGEGATPGRPSAGSLGSKGQSFFGGFGADISGFEIGL